MLFQYIYILYIGSNDAPLFVKLAVLAAHTSTHAPPPCGFAINSVCIHGGRMRKTFSLSYGVAEYASAFFFLPHIHVGWQQSVRK